MKKYLHTALTGIVALVLPAFVNAADLTEPAPKNVLIEDFTGIHCSNCPRGHAILAGMLQEQHDRVVGVGIHTGDFAQPMTGQPDFRLTEGESYMNRFNITSFPSALINRAPFLDMYPLGTNLWELAARAQAELTADVNLQIDKAELNVTTHTLKVKVSGCFTAEPPTDPLITLWITQSGLYGPQTGASKGNMYQHDHVLRVVLTDKWGDALPAVTKGEVFTFEKEFTLPESVRDIPLTPGDLEIVAFVSQQKREVLNVTKAHLTYPGYNPEPAVRLTAALEAVPYRYGWKFIDIRLTNLTNKNITDAEFKITENSGAAQYFDWTGEIAPSATKVVRVPLKAEAATTNYSIIATKVNGSDVTSNTLEGSFNELNVESPKSPTLEFYTNANTTGHTWNLLDDQGNVVQTFGPYAATSKTYKQTLENLESGRVYCIEVRNDWGGSINQGANLYDGNKKLLELLGGYNPAVRSFFRVAGTVGLDEIDIATENAPVEYFDVTGRRVLNPTPGQMLIRVSGNKAEKVFIR